jgi:hypothetical protein
MGKIDYMFSLSKSSHFKAAMAAMMNSAAAANPMLQLAQLGTQNPQMLRQISSHPQFQQIMQMYMQQMKTAGGKK